MDGPDVPRTDVSDDDLGAALSELDAAEAGELEALGRAVGVALGGSSPQGLDAATVDAIWTRVEPEVDG